MGYHIILRCENGEIKKHYSDTFEGLCKFDGIDSHSIIYQAAKEWEPSTIGSNDQYKLLANDWYRAGIRAQWKFYDEAKSKGLVPEKISQDPETFEAYTSAATRRIKRGDYLLRKSNVEAEVKCLQLYYNKSCYLRPYADIKAHQEMHRISNVPVWFAIYERNGDSPVENSLKMISLEKIIKENNKSIKYDEINKCLVIPIGLLDEGFAAI